MCIVCKRRFPKSELLRLVENSGTVFVDDLKRLPGRGAYVCNSCRELAVLNYKGCLNRGFKTNARLTWGA